MRTMMIAGTVMLLTSSSAHAQSEYKYIKCTPAQIYESRMGELSYTYRIGGPNVIEVWSDEKGAWYNRYCGGQNTCTVTPDAYKIKGVVGWSITIYRRTGKLVHSYHSSDDPPDTITVQEANCSLTTEPKRQTIKF